MLYIQIYNKVMQIYYPCLISIENISRTGRQICFATLPFYLKRAVFLIYLLVFYFISFIYLIIFSEG